MTLVADQFTYRLLSVSERHPAISLLCFIGARSRSNALSRSYACEGGRRKANFTFPWSMALKPCIPL